MRDPTVNGEAQRDLVVAPAPTDGSSGGRDGGDQLDRAGQSILHLLDRAAGVAEGNLPPIPKSLRLIPMLAAGFGFGGLGAAIGGAVFRRRPQSPQFSCALAVQAKCICCHREILLPGQ